MLSLSAICKARRTVVCTGADRAGAGVSSDSRAGVRRRRNLGGQPVRQSTDRGSLQARDDHDRRASWQMAAPRQCTGVPRPRGPLHFQLAARRRCAMVAWHPRGRALDLDCQLRSCFVAQVPSAAQAEGGREHDHRAINRGVRWAWTVTNGQLECQVRGPEAVDRSDSQADSADSIPVTRSNR